MSGAGLRDRCTAMSSARKTGRRCRLTFAISAAMAAGAAMPGAAELPLAVHGPITRAPRYGVAAAWPRWTLSVRAIDGEQQRRDAHAPVAGPTLPLRSTPAGARSTPDPVPAIPPAPAAE